ncbi:MAG: holin [Clostridia bacterium]|nr:holin [Clostridia bacterium]
MQNRLKSWALWVAVASLLAFCLKEFSGADIGETLNGFLNVLLPVLVGLGIINNPTDKNNF